ncbi:ATP-binding cassette domain-containing protein [Bradyrhizobium sp. BRP22]|uniref:type I secretion system permease/ATPase n=1 Tax=Bradyrhizobium sp. BRP22 TaxID=2793821 RepID=UPI001CD810C6|nr:ATP-binding cassette domain-containing protein [Bradyrhizobium sp. BRP22]MCA1452003.1 ATP-binding cassette domain-containing protein [Bradyrhizobium sp. BRP22]
MLVPQLRFNLLQTAWTPLQAALLTCAGSLGLVFAYSCSYNLLLFAPSIYLLQIYDRVLPSRSNETLLMLTLIVALTVVVGGALDALRRSVLTRLGAWLEDRLRPTVLSACLDHACRNESARASDAYRDLTIVRQFVESGASLTLLDALWIPPFLAVLFLVHPLLGAIGACSVLFLFGLTVAGDLLTEDALAKSAAAFSRSYGRFATVIGSVHLIRSMGMLDDVARRVYLDAQSAQSEHDLAQRRYEVIMLIAKPTRSLAQVLIMGAAAWLVLDHGKSAAIIFVTMLMFSRALAPVEGAVASWKGLTRALDAYQRLTAVLAAVSPAVENADKSPEQPTGDLVVDNIGARVAEGAWFPARTVSFRLAPGECLGIIGPSGSGKSTLAGIIAGILLPGQGRVLLGETDISVLRGGRQGRYLGYLPQDIDLVGETIRDIIARLNGADLPRVMHAAKLAGIHESIMRLPQGYDTVVMNGGEAFSRGFRQRLGLARAFFGEPRLVVLDEPNASLDYTGERVLLDAIEQLKLASITVVIVTHRMGILAATNKIAIMQDGAVTAFGESEDIFEQYLSRPQVVSQVASQQTAVP